MSSLAAASNASCCKLARAARRASSCCLFSLDFFNSSLHASSSLSMDTSRQLFLSFSFLFSSSFHLFRLSLSSLSAALLFLAVNCPSRLVVDAHLRTRSGSVPASPCDVAVFVSSLDSNGVLRRCLAQPTADWFPPMPMRSCPAVTLPEVTTR